MPNSIATPQWDLTELDPTRRWRAQPPNQFPSPWASEWGADQYGLWQTLTIKGIRYKLRFIPRGHFLMGSPEDEPARYEDGDQQHQVTLSQGFWLGETTVTQALWLAVMGENPSEFKAENNEDLPVERVSWDDCIAFCKQLQEHKPSFNAALPTEAQWEYACRAGTQTPFSTGEQLTTAQANYDGNYPYKGRQLLSKQEQQSQVFRQKTIDVHEFLPNAWGLKQMHGNVWEWCADSLRQFAAEQALDPVGASDSERRALRGGSWISRGRYCRSANRDVGKRDSRSDTIGLRLQGLDAEPASESHQ